MAMEQAIADHQCHDMMRTVRMRLQKSGRWLNLPAARNFQSCDGDRHSWLKSRGRKFEQAIVDDENSTCEDVIGNAPTEAVVPLTHKKEAERVRRECQPEEEQLCHT